MYVSRIVKLASPKLNYLIITGSFLLYVAMIVFVIPKSNTVEYASFFCNAVPWLTAIGYNLGCGTILMKMIRIFYIFRNPGSKKKVIQIIL